MSQTVSPEHQKIMSGIPPEYLENVNGRTVRNPAHTQYVKQNKTVIDAVRAQKAIQESGIELVNPGTVTRSVSNALQGKARAPNDGHGAWQYNIVMANQMVKSGQISIDKYQELVNKYSQEYKQHQHDFSMRAAKTAATTAESNRVKTQTATTIAAEKGIAFGTPNKDGTINISKDSKSSKTDIDNFSRRDQQVPVAPTQQLQRNERYLVTTPDGKERIFKDRETANRFIQRVEGSYVTQTYAQPPSFGPQQPTNTAFVPNDLFGYTPNEKPQDILSKTTEDALKSLDDFSLWKPKNQGVAAAKTILDPLAGFSKATLSTFAFFGNLGRQGYVGNFVRTITGQPIRTEPVTRDIKIPDTFIGKTSEDILSGKDPTKTAFAYIQSRGVATVIGELGEVGIGAGGGKAAVKVLPIKISKYNQPGVVIKSTEVSKKIKTPIGTPQVVTKEVKPAQISFGYGTHTKPIVSKVGSKITLGDVNLSKVSAEVSATTGKQTQRGVKLAADSTQFEQKVNKQIVQKIEGLSESEIEKAKIIDEIVDITTKPKKDTLTSGKMGEETFSTVTKTEQPSFVGSLKKEQGKLLSPIGAYEGSLSHQYFVLPKYLRQAGDVDLHASSYDKAARQISNITPRIQADPGRKFVMKLDPKHKAAKIKTTDINFGGQPLTKGGDRFLDKTLTGEKTKSLISGESDHLEFHHLLKGQDESGIILTTKEHIGITALQGEMGTIPKIKGQEQILKLFGEQTGDKKILKENIDVFLSDPENVKLTKNILNQAYDEVMKTGGIRKNKREKVLEILTPEEVDGKGISQVIEGDTLFGKAIPTKTYKVEEGKTFGRQRQILKKGESIYSIQTTEEGLKLEPVKFRKQKDEADFFALVKSAQETEFKPGSVEHTRLGKLIDDYKSKLDFDVEDFLTRQKGVKEIDRVPLRSEQSLLQKSAGSAGKSIGSVKTSVATAKSLGGTSKLSIGNKSTSGKSLSSGKSSLSTSAKSPTFRSSPSSLLGKSPSSGKSSSGIGGSTGSPGGSTGSPGGSLGSSTGRPPGGKDGGSSSSGLSITANITTPITQRKPVVFGAIFDFKNTTKKTKGTKIKSHDFLGNTNVSSVWGFRTVKKDIDVGDKRTESLYRKNVKKTDSKLKNNWYNRKVIKKKSFLSL